MLAIPKVYFICLINRTQCKLYIKIYIFTNNFTTFFLSLLKLNKFIFKKQKENFNKKKTCIKVVKLSKGSIAR